MRAAGVLVCVAACLAPLTTGSSSSSCSSDELAVYRVFLDTHWSRELFPKQYPEWRPPAGWSKLIGRTHDSSYQLFREGEQASAGLQLFAEKGQSDGLEAAEHAGVYDEFTAPPVPRGVGRSVADFFLDGNHTLVDPMDAGTDNGFTFTAPNWPSEPKEPIARITSKRPSHPANSFFYPKLDKLPSIATLTFIKERVYHLSTEATRGRDPLLDGNEISNELPPGLGLSLGPLDSTESAIRRTSKTRRSKKGQAKHCQVSEWSPWSACSVSCGVGDATRTRRVLEHPRRGGRACPPLQEQRWCGGHSECPQNFFNW